VAVPGLKKDQVDPRVYKAPLKNLKGNISHLAFELMKCWIRFSKTVEIRNCTE
jgi:hypothetical protein